MDLVKHYEKLRRKEKKGKNKKRILRNRKNLIN
jgi:hypothetical protein